MIIGTHFIQYSTDADSDRAFLRDVLKFSHVDAGGGWLIFKMPPTEMAFHPGATNDGTELYFMTDNLEETIGELRAKSVEVTTPHEERWGKLVYVTLPSGGRVGLYQPYHPLAIS